LKAGRLCLINFYIRQDLQDYLDYFFFSSSRLTAIASRSGEAGVG